MSLTWELLHTTNKEGYILMVSSGERAGSRVSRGRNELKFQSLVHEEEHSERERWEMQR